MTNLRHFPQNSIKKKLFTRMAQNSIGGAHRTKTSEIPGEAQDDKKNLKT
jgi:hypothetical protein